MFKNLRKKIELGVAQSPLAGAIKRGSDAKPENETTPTKADDSGHTLPGASGDDSPAKMAPSSQEVVDGASSNPAVGQLVDIPLFNHPLEDPSTPTNGTPHTPRSRQSSISSVGSESPFFPALNLSHQAYDLPSEAESEMDESISTLDGYTKEDLYNVIKRLERRSIKYKGRFKDVVSAYKDLLQDKEKIKNSLTLSQDKAFRRISELKEQAGLDRLAKRDLEENYRLMLEEKDEFVSVLQTQVRLLKEGKSVPEEIEAKASGNAMSKSGDGDTGGGDAQSTAALLEKIKRQDALLNRCKESIKNHKERIVQLSSEKLNLEQLLEDKTSQAKEGTPPSPSSDAENSKLKKQIQQARQVIEDLEADKQYAVAEAKQQMHEELEAKDQEIINVKATLQTQTDENIQLNEINEKLRKSAEEKLQKSREIIKRLKDEKSESVIEMEERLRQAEESLEQEKQSLVQELSRGKAAAVILLQEENEKRLEALISVKDSSLKNLETHWQEKLTELEKTHQEALLAKGKERDHALHQQEEDVQRRLAEKEEEMRLTVEERDLQKMAALSQQDSAKDDLLQQMETFKLAKLEMENLLVKLKEDHESESLSWQKEREDHASQVNDITKVFQNDIEKLKSDHDAKCQEQAQNFNEIQIQQIGELNRKHEEMVQGSSSEVEEFYKAQLETLKTGHESILHDKSTQIEKLNETVTNLQEKIKTVEAEAATKVSDEISAKENLVATYESEATELKTSLQMLTELKEEMSEKLEAKDIEMNALQATFRGNLETSNSEWKQKLDELESEHKKHVDQVSQSDNTRVTEAESKVDQLHQQIEELTKAHLVLSEEKVNVEESRQMLESAMEALKNQVENEAHSNADVKEQLEKTVEELTIVKKSLEEKATELNLLDARCQDLDSQLTQSNTIAEEKTFEIQKMQEKFGQLKTEAKSRIKDLKERTDKMADDLASKTEEVQTLNIKLEEANSSKTTEITMLQEILNETVELHKSLEESFKEKFNERQQQYKDKLQKSREDFQTQLGEKEQEFQEKLNEIYEQREESLEGAANDLESVRQKQLEELTASHQRQLQDIVSEWENKLSDCKEKHSAEVIQVQQSYSEQLDSLKEQVEQISTARQSEVNDIQQQFEAVSNKLKDTESALEQVNSQKEQELSVIKEHLVSVQNSSSGQMSSLQEEREKLISQHDSLMKTKEEQISGLEEQVATLKESSETITEKHVAETQEKDLHLQNAQREIQELQTANKSLEETITTVSSSSSDSEKQFISLKEEHLSVIKTFEASAQEKNSLLDDLQQRLQVSELSIKESETTVSTLKEELLEKTQKLETVESEYVSSNSEKQTILEKLQEQIPKLETSLSEKEQAFVELRSLYEILERSSSEAVTEKESRISELNQLLEMATEEKLQLKEQYEDSLQRVQNEMGAKVTEQQGEMEESLRKALLEEERVKGELTVQIDVLKAEHSQQMSDRDSELSRLQQQVNILDQSQEKIKTLMSESKEAYEIQTSENLSKDTQIENLQKLVESKEQQLEQFKVKQEQFRQKARERLDEQKQQINDKESQIVALTDSLAKLTEEQRVQAGDIEQKENEQKDKVKKEIRNLDLAHESAMEAIKEEYNARITDLTANDGELQEQLRQLREKLNETEERLHECIHTYDSQISEHKAEHDRQQQSFSEEKSLLQQQLHDMDTQSKLTSEGLQSSLQAKVREAEQNLLEVKHEHSKQMMDLESQASTNLQELKQKYNAKLKEIKGKLTGRINEIENLKTTELSELNTKINHLETQLHSERSEKEALSTELSHSNTKLLQFEDVQLVSQERLDKSESQVVELTTTLQGREVEVEKLKKVTKERENLVSDLIKSQEAAEEKAKEFENEQKIKNEDIDSLKFELLRKTDSNIELESKLQKLSDDISIRLETSEKRHSGKMQEQLNSYAESVEIAQNRTKELENELNNVHVQHRENLSKVSQLEDLVRQWKDRAENTQLALDTSKNEIETLTLKLETVNSESAEELLKLKTLHDAELRDIHNRVDTDGNSKISEYKKKAETYLIQMKKQFQEDKDSIITEKDAAISQLETKLINLQSEIQQLSEEKITIISTNEAAIDKIQLSFAQQLKDKEDVIVENLRSSESSQVTLSELEDSMCRLKEDKEELNNKLVALEKDKNEMCQALEEKVKSLEKERSKISKQFDKFKTEKVNEIEQLEKTNEENLRKLQSEYEEERQDMEGKHSSQIKQLVKELNLKLAEKEQEFQDIFREAIGKSNRGEDRLMIEHKQMMEELHSELHDKDKHIEEITELHAQQLQEKEGEALEKFKDIQEEVTSLQGKITLLSSEHEEALQLLEEQLEAGFKKRLADKEVSHREEIDALSKEWNAERQIEFVSAESTEKSPQEELVVENQLALTAIQSGSNSGGLLRQQLIDQAAKVEDLKSKHKLEVAELRSQIEMGQNRQPLMAPPGHRNLFEEFEPRAAEEIQNLELHNMDLQAQLSQLNSDLRRLEEREKQLQEKLEESFHQSPGVSFHTPGASYHTPPSSPYPMSNNSTPLGPLLNEPTEMEYLRNILFQYMIGKETKTLAKVIATVMKFTDDQTSKIIAKEDSKLGAWLSSP